MSFDVGTYSAQSLNEQITFINTYEVICTDSEITDRLLDARHQRIQERIEPSAA